MTRLSYLSDSFARIGLKKDLEYLTHNVGLLLGAGVDVASALQSVESGVQSERLKRTLKGMREELLVGETLADVFERSRLFPLRVVLLLRISEASGRLSSQFKMIAMQEEKQRALVSKVRTALMYPGIVFVLTLVVGIGVSWFILPRLAKVFTQLELELPLITKIVLGFGAFLGNYGVIAVPVFVFALVLGVYFVFFYPKTKWLGEAFLFAVPGVRSFLREVEMARFGIILGSLLRSGIPILDSLASLEGATETVRYRTFYRHLRTRIAEGDSLKQSFEAYPSVNALFTQPVQQLVIVGGETGRLSEVLEKIGAVYEEKSDVSTKNLSVVLEPLLLFVVWLMVVAVAIGVILPIYNLIGGIHR